MNLRGRWEGKLLDMSGPTAILALDLNVAGDQLKGEFEASFLSPGDDCCGPSRTLAQIGALSGQVDQKSRRVVLNYELVVGQVPVSVTFEGTVVEADPHARRAMVGCYRINKGAQRLTLVGGGCVLWLFAEPSRTAIRAK